MMNELQISEFPEKFTESLLEFCAAPAPESAFIVKLEQRLLERQSQILRSEQPGRTIRRSWWQFSASLARRKWQYAAVVVVVAFALTLLAIGPQRVLAQVQRWLGYVPGIGFVDLENTRVLASPLEETRDGVTLRVEKVIAGPKHTQVIISNPGFTEEDLPWPNEAMDNSDFAAYLLLPDGTQLEMTRWDISVGAGKLEFPALPSDVYQLSLIVPRLPLVPSGALPENWEIPLVLQPADGALINELYPQPYNPTDACDTQHEISLCILNVAQTYSETALQYQLSWPNPDWMLDGVGWESSPELRDNLGHIYGEKRDVDSGGSSAVVAVVVEPDTTQITPTINLPNQTDTMVFTDLSPSASQATLWIDHMMFMVPAQGSFTLDLGENPQIGDSWPLDIHLEIAGFPVHLTGMHLREKTDEINDNEYEKTTILEFDMDPFVEQNGVKLDTFDVVDDRPEVSGGSRWDMNMTNGIYKLSIDLPLGEDGKVPTGSLHMHVSGATLLVHGPWEATWNIPGKDPDHTALPVRLYPTPASQPEDEIRPIIEEVFLSDRLTAVKFSAAGLPQDASFIHILPYDPQDANLSLGTIKMTMEDNLGHRYAISENDVRLQSEEGDISHTSGWWNFSPLEPLAQKVSLNVPGMELFIPGEAGFSVDIPQNLAFKSETYTETVIGGGGPERQETKTHWISDPWPVEITLELAGYQLHFTQAQVEHDELLNPPYKLILKGEPSIWEQGNLHLNWLGFSEVERPDGQIVSIDPEQLNSAQLLYPFGYVYTSEADSSRIQAMIQLDVTTADQANLLAGHYRVELNGVKVWVRGPWRLSFSLYGN